MRYIADDFIEQAKIQTIIYEEINIEESIKIRKNVEELYCKNGYGALWERINVENFGFHIPNNKTIFNKLNVDLDDEIILFFEDSTDNTMFRLKNIADIMDIVAELFGFVFYMSDKDASFLLCWNDHEFVIGAGKAQKWVEELKKSINS